MIPILLIICSFWVCFLTSSTQVAAQPIQSIPLRTERIHPQTILSSTNDLNSLTKENFSLIQQLLLRGDRILDANTKAPGYILGTLNGHQAISQNDKLLIYYPDPLPTGTTLDILRPGPALHDPVSKELLGYIFFRMGSLQTTQTTPEGLTAIVTTFISTMQPGDQLALPNPINTEFNLHSQAQNSMSGSIIYIQDNQEEAASQRVVTVTLGRKDRAVQGLTLPVYRKGEQLIDPVTHQSLTKPSQPVGYAILFQIGNKASFAMLNNTRMPIHLGDIIRSP